MSLSFTAPTKDLKRALSRLSTIADRKSRMPIMANVLIRASIGNSVVLACTDLDVYATTTTTAWQVRDTGDMSVPLKQLADTVKSLSGADVTIAGVDGGVRVTSGTVSTEIRGIPGRDFPKFPVMNDERATVNAATFAELLDLALPSVCQDETRFHLNGVLLETRGDLARTVSTDGHRLTKIERVLTLPETKGVIVCAKGAKEIVKLIGKAKSPTCVSVAIKAPYIHVEYDGTLISAKLIDAQYPPYDQVIPKSHKRTIVVVRDALIAALKRAKQTCCETRGVKLGFGDFGLTLTSDNPDTGTTSERLEAEYDAKDFAIGVNPEYLIDALKGIADERVEIATGAELDPMLVTGALSNVSYIAVVMPMRIET